MCYVYMLECRDGSYYTGYTPDLQRRMRAHTAGKGGHYTHAHPPVALRGLWHCEDATAARRLEYAVKQLTRPEKDALLAKPDTLPERFPKLSEYTYEFRNDVTLTDCLEGRWND